MRIDATVEALLLQLCAEFTGLKKGLKYKYNA